MEENQIYHIYNRGNNSGKIFFEERNYSFFLQRFRYYMEKCVTVYSYCLMPNHFHFLIKVNQIDDNIKVIKFPKSRLSLVEKSLKDFFISYSKSINKAYNRTGSLFQTKFKRKPILDDSYLMNIVAYLHLNPVRAGIVKSAENWNYSSFKSYLYDTDDIVISNKNEVIEWFRGKKNFMEFHEIYRNFQKDRDYLFD